MGRSGGGGKRVMFSRNGNQSLLWAFYRGVRGVGLGCLQEGS